MDHTLETLQRVMQLFIDHVRKVWQAIPDSLRKAAYVRTHARPGDTATRALRRTETARRSAMHATYRHKTRRRNRR